MGTPQGGAVEMRFAMNWIAACARSMSGGGRLGFKSLAVLLLGLGLLGGCSSGPSTTQPSERQAKAIAMWQERCKTAGEKIHRTVEGVEGIYLMKLRPSEINYGDQFRLDDPYGHDTGGEGYIQNFLMMRDVPGAAQHDVVDGGGFQFIEALDPKDGQRYRYTGGMKTVRKMDVTHPNIQALLTRDPNYDLNIYGFVLDKVQVTGQAPRYGVTYDDISTREEREYWIAGSSLKVVDLQTNEVIAERIGYMVDWAQGSRVGGRSPWLLAVNNACPKFPGRQTVQIHQTRNFVQKVLKPSQ